MEYGHAKSLLRICSLAKVWHLATYRAIKSDRQLAHNLIGFFIVFFSFFSLKKGFSPLEIGCDIP
jgi:hypothetical protein